VVQNFSAYKTVPLLQATSYEQPKLDTDGKPLKDASGNPVTETVTVQEQVLPMGPAASQIAIKQLGTNGGGFFNVNSAHPFENATPLSNFFEMLAILLIAAALCYTFGMMVGDTRQGWAVLAAMTLIFVPLLALCAGSEQSGNAAFAPLGIDQIASAMQAGGNMEGKEVRFGIANSALWATATTAASNGSVNSMHDSYTPLGGLVPIFLMQLGEVIYGGVGSGLYGNVDLCDYCRVCGRTHGRAHAGVSGQKDRVLRDADGVAGHPHPAPGGARVYSFGGSDRGGHGNHLQPWCTRLQRGALCLQLAGEQQRQCLCWPGGQ
jgi:K+-transporting ATPase ATPase A chain